MESIITFFIENFPTPKALLFGSPLALLWSFAGLYFAGYLKKRHQLKTGYTRKIFHFFTFFSVAFVNWIWGLPGVCLFGGVTSLVVLYAIIKGDGNLFYEALAREKDAPYRTHYIIAPYFATLLGGIANNILFGPLAVAGYLVTGAGDAIGEPVGTRWGKHRYNVPSFRAIKSTRSYEGSAAVFLVSLLAIIISLLSFPQINFSASTAFYIFLIAIACALTEAVSPHGWDNATMQLIPSLFIDLLIHPGLKL